jgi:translation elongation factor EF-1beta
VKYDFNKRNELLQIDDFEDIYNFIDDLVNAIENLQEYETVTVYGKAKFIEKIIKQIHGLSIGSEGEEIAFGLAYFDADSYDYWDEYVLSVDYEYKLSILPCRNRNGDLLGSDEYLAYCYQEDIEQDLIDFLEKNKTPTLLFGLGEEI